MPLARTGPAEVTRVPVERYRRRRPAPLAQRPLRIVQIADPHLGPWRPVHRLRRVIADLVAHEPDLVLLTGDFLTMEGAGSPGALARALEPLRALPGRCFAIFGNHDHEAEQEVRQALAANGIRLLVDDEAIADTPVGPVQIVGADWVGTGSSRAHPASCWRASRGARDTCASSCCTIRSASATCRRTTSTSRSPGTPTAASSAW